MKKVIIFDYDDTIVDTFSSIYDVDLQVAERLGLRRVTKEEMASLWGIPYRERIKRLHPDTDFEEHERIHFEIYDHSTTKPFEGAVGTLAYLKSKGYRLGIISSRRYKSLVGNLEYYHLSSFFECVQGEESLEYVKPDPRVFDVAIKYFGGNQGEMVYVGDHLNDFEAATKSGLDFIAITTGVHTKEDFQRAGCKKIIESLSELRNIL
ncbi:MAG: hypothetical protein A2119_01845 [Candidatus Colwellbacteria bacterium GWA2_46_10]|uniref:Haloacid dehalogenase n=1 Tax=Candidatus Colwellbacteria bacterium GWA2_46_10 TaxID=1797684 RepID=A0A1G1YWK4_9BACT|nr:MAG: HAD-superfamily hydrolase, subfamily IA, variant 1 [Microgenomates group bacterium GW2011_GWA1_Microgenomates_45_10]KKU18800.1 MAG: HAD-superfamily hydrolase, subfamily IA, variant 1 [Parcubacteria group bacterium GW2011_GWA2_46_10]OGY56762.1 MAG: hypothetical protein A2119_01845 [Candidatus Colwellbacteria bacterium GWA2_46_10]